MMDTKRKKLNIICILSNPNIEIKERKFTKGITIKE